MPLRFDATLKDLARRHPGDYASTFRLGDASDIRALNVDLSVISAATVSQCSGRDRIGKYLSPGFGCPCPSNVHSAMQFGWIWTLK